MAFDDIKNTGSGTTAKGTHPASEFATPPDPRIENPQAPSTHHTPLVLKERFVLEEMIARGGMGEVYKARDRLKEQYQDRDPFLAIKILSAECKTHPDFFMALQREAKKAQSLAHPNIVTVHDFDVDGDTVFMTMEYLTGQTLDDFIKRSSPSPPDYKNLLKIVNDMGQGLAYAHKNHIAHCDFKPGNVFLTDSGTVKILDFGISRATQHSNQSGLDATIFDAGKFGALTPPYASCEMLEGLEPDPRDDIYALACITYELLTGRHPFDRERATIARNKSMKASRIKGLNKKCWAGLLQGLEFDRKNRSSSVEGFLLPFQNIDKSSHFQDRWKSALGLVIIILTTSLTYLFMHDQPKHTIEKTTTNDIEEPITKTSNHIIVNTLSPEQQNKVARLIEAADIHFLVGRINEPTGSNAYDAYQQVLKIDPNNKQAQLGLEIIVNHNKNNGQMQAQQPTTPQTTH